MKDEDRRAPVYERPTLSLIADNIGPHGATLYIGGMEGARDMDLLRAHDIRILVNCAVNLDFDLVDRALLAPENGKVAAGYGALRYYKIGMIDGDGNPSAMMLAGLLILQGALGQTMPARATYPFEDGGNVLVNCRAGRSRSVALVSLLLHVEAPERFPTLDDAVAHVREARALRPDEWFETPKPMLLDAAREAAIWVRAIAKGAPPLD
ncbi:dual specificity protein phosphatase family protein [Salipiger sp.]|uniref:dual specificity protein phosphatase family protein n=1 Tax=Salipiger sp. TaxID=2078585 RepID=UPI003A96A34C